MVFQCLADQGLRFSVYFDLESRLYIASPNVQSIDSGDSENSEFIFGLQLLT